MLACNGIFAMHRKIGAFYVSKIGFAYAKPQKRMLLALNAIVPHTMRGNLQGLVKSRRNLTSAFAQKIQAWTSRVYPLFPPHIHGSAMGYETFLSYCIGALIVVFCGWLFSLKTKGILRLLFNTAAGAFLLVALSAFTPLNIPLNPLSALTVGILGLPGAMLIIVTVLFL